MNHDTNTCGAPSKFPKTLIAILLGVQLSLYSLQFLVVQYLSSNPKIEVGTCGVNVHPDHPETYSKVTSVIRFGGKPYSVKYLTAGPDGLSDNVRTYDDYSTRYVIVDCQQYESAISKVLISEVKYLKTRIDELEEKQ